MCLQYESMTNMVWTNILKVICICDHAHNMDFIWYIRWYMVYITTSDFLKKGLTLLDYVCRNGQADILNTKHFYIENVSNTHKYPNNTTKLKRKKVFKLLNQWQIINPILKCLTSYYGQVKIIHYLPDMVITLVVKLMLVPGQASDLCSVMM